MIIIKIIIHCWRDLYYFDEINHVFVEVITLPIRNSFLTSSSEDFAIRVPTRYLTLISITFQSLFKSSSLQFKGLNVKC